MLHLCHWFWFGHPNVHCCGIVKHIVQSPALLLPTPSLVHPNIFFNILFSVSFSPCFSFSIRDQVSHPYQHNRWNVTRSSAYFNVLFLEEKKYCGPNSSRQCLSSVRYWLFLCIQFWLVAVFPKYLNCVTISQYFPHVCVVTLSCILFKRHGPVSSFLDVHFWTFLLASTKTYSFTVNILSLSKLSTSAFTRSWCHLIIFIPFWSYGSSYPLCLYKPLLD